MAEVPYGNERAAYGSERVTIVSRPNWGAIWSGVFTFIGIWFVFGLLGMAIFASSASPSAEHPITGMRIGEAIWVIVLTVISMYVAGRTTGDLAGVENSRDGILHGMVMFGLSVAATLVIMFLTRGTVGNGAQTSPTAAVHSSYMLTMFADLGWVGFIALFLGWLAALGGASTGVKHRVPEATVQQQVRHA